MLKNWNSSRIVIAIMVYPRDGARKRWNNSPEMNEGYSSFLRRVRNCRDEMSHKRRLLEWQEILETLLIFICLFITLLFYSFGYFRVKNDRQRKWNSFSWNVSCIWNKFCLHIEMQIRYSFQIESITYCVSTADIEKVLVPKNCSFEWNTVSKNYIRLII